jgi:[CysO sulfur-carrier protein]-S-L-cysteine hydrolase
MRQRRCDPVSEVAAPARLRIPRVVANALLGHARATLPHEACGLLSGRRADGRATAFHPARNEHDSPLRYSVHPEDLVRIMLSLEAAGEELVAVFHSHVGSAAVPSTTDVREARWPDALHLLASVADPGDAPGGALRAWRIRDGAATEVPLEID